MKNEMLEALSNVLAKKRSERLGEELSIEKKIAEWYRIRPTWKKEDPLPIANLMDRYNELGKEIAKVEELIEIAKNG